MIDLGFVEMMLQILHIVFPVLAAEIVSTAADVVADITFVERLAERRHLAVMDKSGKAL
jgi:hypothetical protein